MKRLIAAFAGVVLALPALGRAQDDELERRFDVQLNGGIGGWTGETAGDTTNVGPYYGVMAAYNQSQFLAFEAGYQGITNSFSDPSDGSLSANRLQGDVRANLPLAGAIAWRPYVFAGLAIDYIAAGDENLFGYTNTLMAEVPLGLGADFFTDSVVRVGARTTFNWNPGIGGEASVDNEHPNSWQAGVTASANF